MAYLLLSVIKHIAKLWIGFEHLLVEQTGNRFAMLLQHRNSGLHQLPLGVGQRARVWEVICVFGSHDPVPEKNRTVVELVM